MSPFFLLLFGGFSACLESSGVRSMRAIKTQDGACRPSAFSFCEMPIITSLSEEPYPAFPGENLSVHCQAYGSPAPVITWFRVLSNGESIDVPSSAGSDAGNSHMVNEAGMLRIRFVVPHDDGKYFCMASNVVGDSKVLIEIKVSRGDCLVCWVKQQSTYRTDGSVPIAIGRKADKQPDNSIAGHADIQTDS